MSEPTRYAKTQEKKHKQERHADRIDSLTRGTNVLEEYDLALEHLKEPTACIKGGLPSKWSDWDDAPEHREPQDGVMPTADEAEALCEGCPLMRDDVCYRYALATNQTHGVWGGRRILNGTVVSGGRDSIDRPNRERGK